MFFEINIFVILCLVCLSMLICFIISYLNNVWYCLLFFNLCWSIIQLLQIIIFPSLMFATKIQRLELFQRSLNWLQLSQSKWHKTRRKIMKDQTQNNEIGSPWYGSFHSTTDPEFCYRHIPHKHRHTIPSKCFVCPDSRRHAVSLRTNAVVKVPWKRSWWIRGVSKGLPGGCTEV